MIVIEVDFNHLDHAGRLLLADLVVHERTPFGEIAASGERLLFVDGGEFVEGSLAQDAERGWVGIADWATQDRLRSYPPDRPAFTPARALGASTKGRCARRSSTTRRSCLMG